MQTGNWSVHVCVWPKHGQDSADTSLHPPWQRSWGSVPQAWQRGQVCAHSRAWGVGWTSTAGHQYRTALTGCSGSPARPKTQHSARKGWETLHNLAPVKVDQEKEKKANPTPCLDAAEQDNSKACPEPSSQPVAHLQDIPCSLADASFLLQRESHISRVRWQCQHPMFIGAQSP